MSGGVTIKDNKFTMPNDNVEVKAIFEEDTPPAPTEHTVTVTSGGNGTASASPAKAAAGAEITLSAKPNKLPLQGVGGHQRRRDHQEQ